VSRVWKRFLLKLSKGLSVIAYVLLAMAIPEVVFQLVFNLEPGIGSVVGMITFIALPVFGFILYDVYKDCKYEVERENRSIMHSLGKKYE